MFLKEITMRKRIVACMFVVISGMASAQENEQAQPVPPDVIDAFSMLYPKAKEVLWNHKDGHFEANFTLNIKNVSVLFDKTGDLKQVKNVIKGSELPIDVNSMLTKDYSAWKIRRTTCTDIRGTLSYGVEVEKEDQTMTLTFDKDGILIKESAR